ncbi:MAG: DNA-processing protein DprA [Clostridia bacterium]|nr:DNA-processing protein DprA [Clostridia bacterium]
MRENALFWIWLSEALGAANRDFKTLIDLYEGPYELFHVEEEELDRVQNISERTRSALANKSLQRATEVMDCCERFGIGILSYSDPQYPPALRSIKTPPVLLYYRGTVPDFGSSLSIAMVGTRRMSAYGLQSAYKISYELAAAGAVVVSGMAAGIDGVCAAASLAAEGGTVAVLGCGLDVVYPKHHKKLMEEISKRGLILSEYPPGTRPNSYHFPIRNRLISGLSQGTVVVEAGLGSGSLITAREAILQGRDVFALPANVGSEGAEGTNGLLRDGARLVLGAQDILKPYQYVFAKVLKPERLAQAQTRSAADFHYLERMGVIELTSKSKEPPSPVRAAEPENLPKKRVASRKKTLDNRAEEEAAVKPSPQEAVAKAQCPMHAPTPDETLSSLSAVQLEVLRAIPDDRAISADALCGLGHPHGDVIAALTMLEILGLVQKLPGALYTKS